LSKEAFKSFPGDAYMQQKLRRAGRSSSLIQGQVAGVFCFLTNLFLLLVK
jgi:hypothetical protein